MGTLAVLSLLPLAGQTASKAKAPASQARTKGWTAPLAPDGHPDLQGTWLSKAATPLERPKQLEGRQSLTDAEVAQMKKRAQQLFKTANSDFAVGDAVFQALLSGSDIYKNPGTTAGTEWMIDLDFDNRTSLITDPPDGRVPPLTPQARERRTAAIQAARRPPSGARDFNNLIRCLSIPVPRIGGRFGSGPDSFYQVVQTPGYVMLLMEDIHDVRIIPLDGSPHLPSSVRAWNGDSRGRWEGKSLVVDTTNFSAGNNFMGSDKNLHLVERFTRVAADELDYEVTLEDGTTWTRPWSAMVRLKQTNDKIFEVACHEGNMAVMEDMLRAARAADKAAGESK